MADEVLHSGVSGITDLMIKPGLINLDFADVRTVMNEMGKAMMGTGEATGDNRAIEAAEAAIANPLLDDVSMQGANGVLINISGGDDMTLYELDEAATRIKDEVAADANIIIGSTFDASLKGTIRVSVVATGIESEAKLRPVNMVASAGVIAMTPAQTQAPEAQAEPELADGMSMPEAPVAEAEPMSAPATELPSFLTTKPAVAPRQEIPKQSRSFIERVFGGKKKPPTDTTSALVDAAEASEAPSADMMSSAFQQAEAELQQAEVAEAVKAPVAPVQEAAPAGFAADLDGPAPVTAPIIKPKEVATAAGENDLVAEIEVKETAEVKATETAEVEEVVEEAPKMQAPDAPKQEAPKPEMASQPIVSAPAPAAISTSSVSASASAPAMQSTMQTTTSSMSSSSFDADQLDIPAFLRR